MKQIGTDLHVAMRILAAAERPVLGNGESSLDLVDDCSVQVAATVGQLRDEGLVRCYRSIEPGQPLVGHELIALTRLGARALTAMRESKLDGFDSGSSKSFWLRGNERH